MNMSKMGKGALAILLPFYYHVSHEWAISSARWSVCARGSTPFIPTFDLLFMRYTVPDFIITVALVPRTIISLQVDSSRVTLRGVAENLGYLVG